MIEQKLMELSDGRLIRNLALIIGQSQVLIVADVLVFVHIHIPNNLLHNVVRFGIGNSVILSRVSLILLMMQFMVESQQ